jgi:hypothetical protein
MNRLISILACVVLLQSLPLPGKAQEAQKPAPASLDPVEAVVTAGLMTKFPDGNFHAEKLLSRAELAVILVKAFQLDERVTAETLAVEAQDVPSSHWAYPAIQTVLKTGTMRGYRGGAFYPNQKITRAEALAIFAQAYGVFQFPEQTVESILGKYSDAGEVPSWAKKAMATALYEGFVNSQTEGRIYPSALMTRGDLAYTLSQYLERQRTGSF